MEINFNKSERMSIISASSIKKMMQDRNVTNVIHLI